MARVDTCTILTSILECVVPTIVFGVDSLILEEEKRLVVASTLEDKIEVLLEDFLIRDTTQDFAKKLVSRRYIVAILLQMSELELNEVITTKILEVSMAKRREFKAII